MFTGTGKTVGALAVLFLIGAAALSYPELAVLGMACVFTLVAALAWISLRADVIAVRDIVPAHVGEGEQSTAVLTVTNRARSRRTPPMVAEERVGAGRVNVQIPSIAPNHSHRASYDLPTAHRGVFDVGPMTIGRSDPLRLMQTGRAFSSTSRLWVYPRVSDVRAVPTGQTRDADGPTSSSAPEGGVAFHEIREFVWGDDYRLVHWRSTARTGTLQIRQMVVPDEPRVLIVLDTSSRAYPDDSFEDAVRVTASLAQASANARFPVEVATTAEAVARSDKDGSGLMTVMDLLAGVSASDTDPGLGALFRLAPEEHGVSLAVVTGQLSAGELAAVVAIRPLFQMVSLAQVGEKHGRPPMTLPGVVGVNVATSDDFPAAWNHLVGP